MDGSSSHPRSQNPPLPSSPTLFQVPPISARRSHYRSLLQDHPQETGASAALPSLPTFPPPSYHQLYHHPGVYYTPPFVPGLDPSADPIQQQPRIAQGPFSSLPEWQPDHLVRNCPICESPFTLFFRRHHCRKCGRVVCAQCSPNRLTIPSSMVVRPPGEMSPTQVLDALGVAPPQWGGLLGGSAYSTPSIDTANRHSWAGSISSPGEQSPPGLFDWRISEETPTGMEEVRVCSDCYSGSTPGPNDARHISAATASIHRTWNGSSSSATQGRPLASELWSSPGINTPDANGRRRRQSLQGGRSLPYYYDPSIPPLRQSHASYAPQSSITGSNNTHPPPVPSPQSQAQQNFYPGVTPKYANYLAARERAYGLSGSVHHGPSSVHMQPGNPSQHASIQHMAPPQAQANATTGRPSVKLKETDYCPICTLPLPPPHPDTGNESAREAHIQGCIRNHETASNPTSATASPADNRGALGSTPSGMNVAEFLRQSGTGPPKASGRMVVYSAREEDTWDYSSDDRKEQSQTIELRHSGADTIIGAPSATTLVPPSSAKAKCRKKAECVICFEDFEVGEAIARLECLCRYHKSCIREWFDRKGNGDCPVHAVRE